MLTFFSKFHLPWMTSKYLPRFLSAPTYVQISLYSGFLIQNCIMNFWLKQNEPDALPAGSHLQYEKNAYHGGILIILLPDEYSQVQQIFKDSLEDAAVKKSNL